MAVKQTDHAKMIFLIQRRETTSREELLMHWYKNHMPAVIEGQKSAASRGRPAASRYIAQLFNTPSDERAEWDGMAQLWFEQPQPPIENLAGVNPTDTFQEKAEPYFNWATREYVVMDGSERLSTAPLTLNEPYPATRSGFFRVNFLVAVKPETDFGELYDHWLNVHVPNVEGVMNKVGGFRYVVSHSIYPDRAPYAGMAELYFDEESQWHEWRTTIQADGMEKYVDSPNMPIMVGGTEMIGIP